MDVCLGAISGRPWDSNLLWKVAALTGHSAIVPWCHCAKVLNQCHQTILFYNTKSEYMPLCNYHIMHKLSHYLPLVSTHTQELSCVIYIVDFTRHL